MATTTRLTATEFLEWEGNERHVQRIDVELRLDRGDTLSSPRLPGCARDLVELFDEP